MKIIDLTYRYFEHPYYLLLIIPAVLLLWYLIDKDFIKLPLDKEQQRKLSTKRLFIFITRVLVLLLLFIALAGPFVETFRTVQGDPKVRLLIDNSSSMQVFDINDANKLKSELEKRIPVEIGYIGDGEKSALGDNIIANLKKNENVLLFTDGYSNSGIELGDIVLKANSLNSSVSAINLKPKNYDASIVVYGSEKTTADAENVFTVAIKQTERKPVHVIIEVDGINVVDTTTESKELTFNKKFDVGYHKITAKLDANDFFKNNNIFYKTIKVVPKPRVLIYSKDAIEINKLFEPVYATTITSDFPNELGVYTALVVDNMEIKNVEGKSDMITDFVADGNGLFVVGGGSSFDFGGYKGSRFEQILPVFVAKAGRKTGVNNIIIVIDISGSTGNVFGETYTKVDIEKAIALDMIRNLSLVNNVGVVAFNTRAYKVFDIKQLLNQPDMSDIIMRLIDNGGTYISQGLLMAIEMLKDKGGSKNIILISDGINQDRDEAIQTTRLASSEGIRIYTIGIGEDTDAENMQTIAGMTGGAYFEPDSADRVRIMFGDVEVSGDKKVFPLVVFDRNHFITQGLKLKGSLYGFNQVVPKNSAKLLISDDIGDPILTVSRLGLGRVAALATDYKIYGFELLNKENSLLLTRTVNWVIGDPERKNKKFVDIRDGRSGNSIEIKVKSDVQPSSSDVALYKVDEDLYVGSVLVNEVGFKRLLDGVFAVNYKLEYEGVGLSENLDKLVRATSGQMFEDDKVDEIVEFIKLKSKRDTLAKDSYKWVFALAALIIYLIEVGFRRIVRNKK